MEYTRGRDDEFEFKINDDILELRIDLSKNQKRISKRAGMFLIATTTGWFQLHEEGKGSRDESLNLNIGKRRTKKNEYEYED
jgi:hypothetical protein